MKMNMKMNLKCVINIQVFINFQFFINIKFFVAVIFFVNIHLCLVKQKLNLSQTKSKLNLTIGLCTELKLRDIFCIFYPGVLMQE